MRPTVFLFDIDGTILDCSGAGRRAMEGAFEAVCPGHLPAMGAVKFAGMTDPGIVRAALTHAGLACDPVRTEATIGAVLVEYVARIERELSSGPQVVVFEGVEAALQTAESHSAGAVGLGTGNHRDGARHKLAAAGLWERFAFGGFGSDAEPRADMLSVGRDRGAARLGVAPSDCQVIVIGDTPRDVAAARAIGARCLAVTTGRHDARALREAGADRVVARLSDPEALRELRAVD